MSFSHDKRIFALETVFTYTWLDGKVMDIIQQICSFSGMSFDKVNALICDKNKYRVFYVRKKDGTRMIAEPCRELKVVMHVVNWLVFKKLGVSKISTAYNSGCSIVKNALPHRNAEVLYKFDIKSFFPSITYNHISALLEKKYSKKEIDFIYKIVEFKGGLAIGAPTSPFIANAVCLRMDKQLIKECKGASVTRYADDITVSYKKQKKDKYDIRRIVLSIVKDNGFVLNAKKTRTIKGGYAKRVCGITIGKTLTVGHKYKDALKKQIYDYLAKGKGQFGVIKGRIAFVKSVEPAYADMLKRKYSKQFGKYPF